MYLLYLHIMNMLNIKIFYLVISLSHNLLSLNIPFIFSFTTSLEFNTFSPFDTKKFRYQSFKLYMLLFLHHLLILNQLYCSYINNVLLMNYNVLHIQLDLKLCMHFPPHTFLIILLLLQIHFVA
mgnify:CR=1 FL=1